MTNHKHDQFGAAEAWQLFMPRMDTKSGRQVGFTDSDGKYHTLKDGEELVFIKQGKTREPIIKQADGNQLSFAEWSNQKSEDTELGTETDPTQQQLGEQYWTEELAKYKTITGYQELRDAIVTGLKKSTGIGNNLYQGDGIFIGREFAVKNGKLDDEDLKRIAGRRILAAENGLQVGPYEVNLDAGTAVAKITDTARLENLIEKSNGEKTVKLEQADIVELNNLLDRASKDLETAAKQDTNFEQLSKLANEWKNKFPGQEVHDAIISDSSAVNVRKEKQGDRAVIVAPNATADLFKMKLYMERARVKLSGSSDVELDAQKLPIVIKKIWNFIKDTEKILYPDTYHITGKQPKK